MSDYFPSFGKKKTIASCSWQVRDFEGSTFVSGLVDDSVRRAKTVTGGGRKGRHGSTDAPTGSPGRGGTRATGDATV